MSEFVKVNRGRGIIDYRKAVTPKMNSYGERIEFIAVWYNRTERSWVGVLQDDKHYQVGSSDYCSDRECAEQCAQARYDWTQDYGDM